MNRNLVFLILAFICFSSKLYQQEWSEPFSSINISGGILVNSNRNLFHKYWKPEKGFYFQAETPFYFGEISFGLQNMNFQNLKDVPPFENYFIHADWGKEVLLPLNLSITNGFRIGTDIMSFQSTSLSEYEKIESEFAASIYSKINLKVLKGISVSVSGELQNIFTNRRIKLFYLIGGISYRFGSPGWLKDFMQ